MSSKKQERPLSTQKLEEKKRLFIQRLRQQSRLQDSSLRLYEREIQILIQILEKGDPEKLLLHLSEKSPATHQRKLIIWRSFLRDCPPPYCHYLENFKNPIIRQKLPRFLNEDEAFRLESACYRSAQPLRDRLFVSLGLQLGLRVSEILQLRFKDFEADWLRVLRKGGKEQRLPLTGSIQANFAFFKKERKPMDEDFVFQGRSGRPMSVRNAQKIISRLAELADLKIKISPHSLRHSFATQLASNGANLAVLKELLGHQSLTTTERYLHISPQHLRSSLECLKSKKPRL